METKSSLLTQNKDVFSAIGLFQLLGFSAFGLFSFWAL